jgi:RNA polymerase sigma-70 factor, ECF subfamily
MQRILSRNECRAPDSPVGMGVPPRLNGNRTDRMDQTLINSLIAGDRSEWERFVNDHTKLVYATVRRTLTGCNFHTVSDNDVEDLHAAVFSSLVEDGYRRLRLFKGNCSLASWIRVIAVRKVLDFVRHEIPKRDSEVHITDNEDRPLEDLAVDNSSPAQPLMDAERVNAVKDCLKRLPPRERLILTLYAEGRKAEDVARLVSISVANVYVIQHRALGQVRQWLEEKTDALV